MANFIKNFEVAIKWLPKYVFRRVNHKLLLRGIDRIDYNKKPGKKSDFDVVSAIIRENKICMTHTEAFILRKIVKSVKKLPGEIAEVGVFRGGSAKLIRETDDDKALHLFDTFDGLPSPGINDPGMVMGEYCESEDVVRQYLAKYGKVYI
jgi:hypothetical protein